MNANELYKLPTESQTKQLGNLKGFYYDHLPEVEGSLWDVEGNEEVVINTIKDFDFDGRRCWTLRTVFFKEKPVMILQNAGREGDDHRKRFITDKTLFKEMVNYVQSLQDFDDDELNNDLISPEEDLTELTSFYGNELFGTFERY